MTSKIREQQLSKIQVADMSHFDVETNSYFIPKKVIITFEKDKSYIIKLDKSLLNPNNYPGLVSNWNHGLHPNSEYYKALITNILNNMIHIIGVKYNYETKQEEQEEFSGWLPINLVEGKVKL